MRVMPLALRFQPGKHLRVEPDAYRHFVGLHIAEPNHSR